MDPRAPVIAGAGQLSHHGEPRDPVSLAVEAVRAAAQDTGVGDALLRSADSVRCVAPTSWHLPDMGALVAEAIGAAPRETVQTVMFGGDGPQRLIGDTARSIAAGDVDVAVVCGSEAVASVLAMRRSGEDAPWPRQPDGTQPTRVIGTDRAPVDEQESAAGLLAPVYVYALLESAERARAGLDPDAHLRRIAELWSGFSQVAAGNPHAWLREARSADELATASPSNRPVSSPYLKLLTANIQVDQAAALVMCSAEAAERAGVPRDRWVFAWAGAHAQEEWHVSHRASLAESPAIRAMGRAALEHAGVGIDDVAHVDLYSCFPVAVEIAARELGLGLDRQLTVTGGLTFAGGPGNAYSLNATATLVGLLREDPEAVGLSTALGWYMTKHAAGLFSASPPPKPYAFIDADERVERPAPRAVAPSDHHGPATVEAATVAFTRDGDPEYAIVTALTPDGARALVRTEDQDQLATLLNGDPAGLPWEV